MTDLLPREDSHRLHLVQAEEAESPWLASGAKAGNKGATVHTQHASLAKGSAQRASMRDRSDHNIQAVKHCTLHKPLLIPHFSNCRNSYINALEERIAFLEARLPAHAQDHFETLAPFSTVDDNNDQTNAQPYPESTSSHRGSISEDLDGYERNSIIDGVAYLSLCASGTAEATPDPTYLGSSSGAAIARMIQRSIFHNSRHATRLNHRSTRPTHPVDPYLDSLSPTLHFHPDESSQSFPFPDQARHLFDIFFDRMHTRWPILDRKKYTELFAIQYQQGSLSITQRSIMHLIYAIAARFEQLTRKPSQVDHEKHLLAAIEPMDYILEQHNLATVQFLLLLAVHGQRSPYGAGAWSQVRYAVSLCIELGLHRERQGPPPDSDAARDLEIRRRAFWSCYGLDRGTSVVLGRAFAISDRDINVAMPNPGREFWDLTHAASATEDHGTEWCNIEPFIHIIKLEKIQSRIHRTVFRVDKDIFSGPVEERVKLDGKMASIRSNLDMWIQTTPQSPKDNGKITWLYDPESTNQDAGDFYSLQYHKALLSLFTVLLPSLPTADPRFITTAQSAACVCVAYKRLNQQRTLTYTMISLHSCFVAGLTLMYCIWKDKSLFSYHVVEATQACSQSLTVFGEKWAGAVKYRDIFDALSGSLLKTLISPGGLSGHVGMGIPERRPLQTRFDQRGSSFDSNPPIPPPQPTSHNESGQEDMTMRDLVSDAVKEAFMEVDEEAPGGWHGWHMWNEMLGECSNTADFSNDSFTGSATKGYKDVWNLSQNDLDLSRGWE
ncbi:fungal-specific transcription factor domain-containing protein [Fusarium avenaceum]|nr:fungal-specific transcription factor domain-containing protein [Fusarium avenaceum]